jgi:Fe(3+) dicitrate transport protein
MEDGVLISPALCSCSVLFPTVKQNAIFEILKGGSQIQYGPYTPPEAINMVYSNSKTFFRPCYCQHRKF